MHRRFVQLEEAYPSIFIEYLAQSDHSDCLLTMWTVSVCVVEHVEHECEIRISNIYTKKKKKSCTSKSE